MEISEIINLNKDNFDRWSSSYDNDVLNLQGYKGHEVLFRIVNEQLTKLRIPSDIKILDVGCGTGLCGVEFWKCGFKNIYGGDASPSMMKIAESKGVFRELRDMRLGESLSLFKDKEFPLLVAAGVFQPCGPHSSCLKELFRILDLNGLFGFTWVSKCLYRLIETGYDEEVTFHQTLLNWEKEGLAVKLVESQEFVLETNEPDSDMAYKVYIYQRLK